MPERQPEGLQVVLTRETERALFAEFSRIATAAGGFVDAYFNGEMEEEESFKISQEFHANLRTLYADIEGLPLAAVSVPADLPQPDLQALLFEQEKVMNRIFNRVSEVARVSIGLIRRPVVSGSASERAEGRAVRLDEHRQRTLERRRRMIDLGLVP